jgi:hypothetical protein
MSSTHRYAIVDIISDFYGSISKLRNECATEGSIN